MCRLVFSPPRLYAQQGSPGGHTLLHPIADPRKPLKCALHLYGFVISRMFYKWTPVTCNIRRLAVFAQHNSLGICARYLDHNWFNPFFTEGNLCVFSSFFPIMNKSFYGHPHTGFCGSYDLMSLESVYERTTAGSSGESMFHSVGDCQVFFTRLHPFASPSNVRVIQFFSILSSTWCYHHFLF